MNHNSQSDGQNNTAKSGMNLRKKIIHINSLQRKREDTKDKWYLTLDKAGKNGPMKLRTDYRAALMMKNRLRYESGEPVEEPIHAGQQRRHTTRTRSFLWKITSPALELTNIQDGNIGFHLQIPRCGTHPNGVGSGLTIFFCSNLFLLQLVPFTVDSDPL